ncbi:hypothetical protein L53_01000 [Hyphomonas sp. L-53-1-40]|uniref:hypothetical protein n=1 Tax=Hyphomonas sp. L-53-1-40 TaxID=1207058 RepID=UPI000458D75D|nr:hypothetical protein [Hyphomonas sp. L-53-1-40]KCZ65917.1 hypothetical protein L53_01000 [Hyphomonas sp. L-53-1-40]
MAKANKARKRIVLHIEDEFSHWANLNETIEASILEYLILIGQQYYDSFEYFEPVNETRSPVITRMTWEDSVGKQELVWILNYDDDLSSLVADKVFKDTDPLDRFFILDASKRSEDSDPKKTLLDNFLAIDPFLHDTEECVRVFTAYKRDMTSGAWDMMIPIRRRGQESEEVNINDLSHLIISKTGIRGRNSEFPGDLQETVMKFVTGS